MPETQNTGSQCSQDINLYLQNQKLAIFRLWAGSAAYVMSINLKNKYVQQLKIPYQPTTVTNNAMTQWVVSLTLFTRKYLTFMLTSFLIVDFYFMYIAVLPVHMSVSECQSP